MELVVTASGKEVLTSQLTVDAAAGWTAIGTTRVAPTVAIITMKAFANFFIVSMAPLGYSCTTSRYVVVICEMKLTATTI